MEIERKFLLNKFPNLDPISRHQISQGYLSINPEVRIRSMPPCHPESDEFTLCVKGDGTIARQEIEVPISGEQFRQLKELVPGTMIHKQYRKFLLENGEIVHCSLVDGRTMHSFMYAEVEFQPHEDPYAFAVPEWFGKEVTADPEYKMKNYWKRRHAG